MPLIGALAPLQISRVRPSDQGGRKNCAENDQLEAKQKLFEDDKHIMIHDFMCK